MNKNEIFEHFSRVIDTMLDNSLFFSTYWQAPCSLDNNINGSIDNAAMSENIHLNFGISRGCIIDDNFPYVVKFDTETDMYGDSLCQREMDIFRAAKNRGLAEYFIEPIYLGEYVRTIMFYDCNTIGRFVNWCIYDEDFEEDFMNHEDNFGDIMPITISIPLYAYRRVSCYKYSRFAGEDEKKYKEEAMVINSPLRNRFIQIAMEFVYRYGLEKYEELSEFMYRFNINDLHFGNLGSLDENLVIFDYAGFWDEYQEEDDDENYERSSSYDEQ